MEKKHIAVIGGGISGLAFANRLREISHSRRQPFEVSLIEGSLRFGGVIETFRQDGFLIEGGPESFVTDKPWAFNLCERLGLSSELMGTREEDRRSFIYRRKRLREVPEGFYLMGPSRMLPFLRSDLLDWPAKLRVLAEPLIPRRKSSNDESAASFIRRRFGQAALRDAGQAMIAGIYSADPETLSLAATFPKFLEMEKESGSIIRALRKRAKQNSSEGSASGPRYSLFASLREGMESLIKELRRQNPDVHYYLGSPAVRLERTGESWKILLGSGREVAADAVCVALPGPRQSRLLAEHFPEIASRISAVPYTSSVTVNFAFSQRDVISPQFRSFGFVVPASEMRGISACTFSHLKFEGRSGSRQSLLRVFLTGELRETALKASDESVSRAALAEIRAILGFNENPSLSAVRRWREAMPQYLVGHPERTRETLEMAARIPGLYLTGNALAGIGLPDCIRHAEERADQCAEQLLTL